MKRAIAYERVRAFTIRSTFVFPLAGVAFTWAIALFLILTAPAGSDIGLAGLVGQVYSPISALFVTIPFAQAFGHDYRDGTIRLTLGEFPNRTQVYLAKLIVPAVVAVCAVIIAVLGVAVIATLGPSSGFDALPALLLRESLFTVMWGVMVAAITVLTRSMPAGVTGLLIWWLLGEQLIGSLLSKFPFVFNLLPLNNGVLWAQSGAVQPGLIMLLATVVLGVVGYVRFTRRDA